MKESSERVPTDIPSDFFKDCILKDTHLFYEYSSFKHPQDFVCRTSIMGYPLLEDP